MEYEPPEPNLIPPGHAESHTDEDTLWNRPDGGRPPAPYLVEQGDDEWPFDTFEEAARMVRSLIAEGEERMMPQIRERQQRRERVWQLVDDERGRWQAGPWRSTHG